MEGTPFHLDFEFEAARPAHVDPLMDDIGVAAVGGLLEVGKEPGRGRGGAPGRRVLADAEPGGEHARENLAAGLPIVHGEGIDLLGRRPAEQARPDIGIDANAAEGGRSFRGTNKNPKATA